MKKYSVKITWRNKKVRNIEIDQYDLPDFVHDFAGRNGFETHINEYAKYLEGLHEFLYGKCKSIEISLL